MQVMLFLLAALLVLEWLLWAPFLWRVRVPLALITLWGNAAWLGAALGLERATWIWLVGLVLFYKGINLLRIIDNRTVAPYLFQVARRASVILSFFEIVILVSQHFGLLHVSGDATGTALAGLAVAAAGAVLTVFAANTRAARPVISREAYADRDLPTLTVAIPARNETEDLEACLQSLLTSTYPKLEIIVLDDCSQDRRTPEIIRGYAHDGVRFCAGSVPPDGWLAKNYAYAQLAEQANGELLLFAGVDVRFEPDTLKTIVTTMLAGNHPMLSFLPKNDAPESTKLEALFVQPSRYAWELALPRRILPRPPVLSTCWIIHAPTLKEFGGLDSVRRGNQPEGYFAKQLKHLGGGYRFMIADKTIGLVSQKSFAEQRATAVRTRYPQLHRRIELALLLSAAECAVLIGPYLGLIWSLLERRWLPAGLYVIACLLLNTFYSLTIRLTYRRFLLRGFWLEPFAAVYDIALQNYSMFKYEFSEVLWKGRNVCIPIMRVVQHLPPLER